MGLRRSGSPGKQLCLFDPRRELSALEKTSRPSYTLIFWPCQPNSSALVPFFFFFKKRGKLGKVCRRALVRSATNYMTASRRQPRKHEVSLNLMCGVSVSVGPNGSWELQEGVCHSSGCCAWQQGSPTQTPSLLRTPTQEPPFTPGTCVVGDHLPPTSTASTTRRDLARHPTSSGYLRTFYALPWIQPLPRCGLHLSWLYAAPLLLPSPGQWQPIHCHFESASTGCDGCVEVQVTQQHVCTHTATRFSADSGHHTLQSEPPSSPRPLPIEWAATPARTHGQREGELEATQQEEAEMVGTQEQDPTRGTCGENQTTPGASLGSQQGLCWMWETREDVRVSVVPLRACTGLVLPTSTTSPLEFFHFVPYRPHSCDHVSPRWRFKPNPHQFVSNLPGLTQTAAPSK